MSLSSSPAERRRAAARLAALLPSVAKRAQDLLGHDDGEAFVARLEHVYLDLVEPLTALYGSRPHLDELVATLLDAALDAAVKRPTALRRLDRRREIDQAWFQRARMIGYVCYVDRFAETLSGVRDRLDYLAELGVTYLHLMPLLRPRDGENDGGYAVADYGSIDPRLGTMADLEALAGDLHDHGMNLCVDLVINHTAQEHEWAQRAIAGDERYRRFYRVFADRQLPDAYERTLPEVFPDMAPGSFTFVKEMGGWVWTTFNSYQWDLDYSNPDVFTAMLETLLQLVNRGVDVVRLDAVPFTWKRMGTDCQNQPEAHLLLQAFRALVRLAAPGVVFKAEAIVAPEQLVQYLGAHDRYRPECDLAYNNQLMVMLWSSIAARDGRLATASLSRLRPPPASTGWVTYVRCHDDIGWAVSDADAQAIGWDGFAHRRFLNDFYSGNFPGSFARGAKFQENHVTGDARISGMTASLCGITAALESGDDAALEFAIRRLVLLYSVAYSYGGIPLLYMGDEIALGDDPNWADDPDHAGDNRWMHRPRMDWQAAELRQDQSTVQGRVFAALQDLGTARRGLLALRAGGETTPLPTNNPHVLAYRRQHPRSGAFLALAHFADGPGTVDDYTLAAAGLRDADVVHASEPHPGVVDGLIPVPAWGFVWFAEH